MSKLCFVLLACCCLYFSSSLAVNLRKSSNHFVSFKKSNNTSQDISKTNSLWTDCSKSSDPMTIYSINISPTPLRRGSEAYAAMTAQLKQTINGGKLSVVLRYANVMTVIRKRYNLCNFLRRNGHSCPLKEGTVNFTYGTSIPSSIPPGQYTGSVVALDSNGDEIACISLNLNMGA